MEGTSNNLSKILFWILYSIVYLAALYVVVGVVVFLGTHFSDWSDEMTTIGAFNSPYCLPVKVIGTVAILIYIFRDNLTKR